MADSFIPTREVGASDEQGDRSSNPNPSLFISYSRKDIERARELTEAFNARGMDFWIDWDGIPPAEPFLQEINKGIEEADIFLFLLSPDSCKSEYCRVEVEHAQKNGKRLIPVVIRDVKGEDAPEQLASLNWIFLRPTDDVQTALAKVVDAIQTDYSWVRAHRQLQVKALEWERSGQESSFLLRGKELQDAELQLATHALKEPHPTEVQRAYVLQSRQQSDRQRRVTMGVAVGAILVLAALAIFAFVQRNRAVTQAWVSQANGNASLAQAKMQRQLDLSILLSLQAFADLDSFQTRGALWNLARVSPHLRRFLNGHSAEVYAVAFSPDGTRLASAGVDRKIILWDAETGRPDGEPLEGHVGYITSLAFSPDGKLLASASGDLTIILWDVQTHRLVEVLLPGHSRAVTTVAFSPDGRYLATGGEDGLIFVLDVVTGELVHWFLLGAEVIVWSLAFSPDGQTLASGGSDSRIILWDVQSGQSLGEPLTGHEEAVFSVAFHPKNGNILASGSQDRTIRLWNIETGITIGSPLVGHMGYVNSLVFKPDGTQLVSGSGDTDVILWDVETRQPVGEPYEGHSDWVKAVAFSPDGQTLASAGQDSTVILWNLNPEARPLVSRSLSGHTEYVLSVAFSPVGDTFASGSRGTDPGIILWKFEKRTAVQAAMDEVVSQTLSGGHEAGIYSLAFSPDGKLLASGGADQKIILWDVRTGIQIGQPLVQHRDKVTSLAFSPDGKILASGASEADRSIILWDVEAHKPVDDPLQGHQGWVSNLAFSPDGKFLASASGDHTVIIWDLSKRQQVAGPLDGLYSVAFSPDGKWLAIGDSANDILLVDTGTFEQIGQPFEGHTGFVNSLAFSPDGSILISGSNDNKAILWDVESRQPIGQPLEEHTHFVKAIALSPDGSRLLTGSNDHRVILWDVSIESWVEKLCDRVGRNLTPAEWMQYFPAREYSETCHGLPQNAIIYRSLARTLLLTGAESLPIEEAYASLKQQMEEDAGIQEPAAETARLLGEILVSEIFDESRRREWPEVLELIDRAKTSGLELDRLFNSVYYLNVACWYGRVDGYAVEVMEFCDRAVEIAPNLAYIRNSRGIARAVVGDVAGAIEDFEVSQKLYPEDAEVQEWMAKLKAGNNPFAP